MTKTILTSALVLALSGTAHAASHSSDGAKGADSASASSTRASPSTGTSATPAMNTNDGTSSTKDGAKANPSKRSVGTESTPIDYGKSTEYNKYRSTSVPYAARASDVVGADVVNAAHKEIGEVDDVILSRSDNHMHAVIKVGGFLGIGEKLVAVRMDELRMDGHGNVYLNTTEEELKQRPTFAYGEGEQMGMDRWKMRGMSKNRGTLN